MRIAVLGSGMVGKTIATRLVRLGHDVTMGSRTADNPSALAWASEAGAGAAAGTFADAAAAAQLLFNCTAGTASLDALRSVPEADLEGKVLIDVANALDASSGFPPRLAVSNDDSLGEQIQRAFPSLRVVKSLNTMNCSVMVDPAQLPGPHVVFMSGDDPEAKHAVAGVLREFGWPETSIIDLGDITTARGVEMFLPLWVRLYGALGTGAFNIAVVR